MEFLVAIVVTFLGILAVWKINSAFNKQAKSTRINHLEIPSCLGIKSSLQYSDTLRSLRIELENSLDPVYMEQVRKRVLNKNRWTEKEYDVYLFGLKQFFLLNAVLKSVPMFSAEVDQIWHEMLMFTREYQDFCDKFTGEMIHHVPNTFKVGIENSNLRAEFDWLYFHFFHINECSEFIFKEFFHHKFDGSNLKELEKMTVEELRENYFKGTSEMNSIAVAISGNLFLQLDNARMNKNEITKISLKKANTLLVKQDKMDVSDDVVINSLFLVNDTNYYSSTDHSGKHHSSHHSCTSHHSCSSHSCSSGSSCSSGCSS